MSPPGGPEIEREPGLTSLKVVVVTSLVSGHHRIFCVKMNISPDSLPNSSCFELFLKDPKGVKPEVVQGAHKFISDVIDGSEQSPKNSAFIGLFNQFTKNPVKDYIFQRMTKSILQELALCLLQEIISGGPERAASLNLVVEKTKAGGQTVVVEKHDEFPVDEAFVLDIDEAFFRITDLTGSSPDVKVVSGQGHGAPYSPPDERGYFTPTKAKPTSLDGKFEVSRAMGLVNLILALTAKFIPERKLILTICVCCRRLQRKQEM